MILTITSIYAAILGLMFLAFRTMVTIERAKSGISILHQDNMVLAIKIRRFGNFIETVPLALILMGFAENSGASPVILHIIGVLLLASRILHPLGLNTENGAHPIRITSGIATIVSMLIAIIYIYGKILQVKKCRNYIYHSSYICKLNNKHQNEKRKL